MARRRLADVIPIGRSGRTASPRSCSGDTLAPVIDLTAERRRRRPTTKETT